ncbi:MAG: hypothetical protein ACR2NP_08160 [Pirellulaceae bacterium]
MTDTQCQLEMLRLIDQRQQQVLEDLETLNSRIEHVIELSQHQRQTRSQKTNSRQDAA